MKKTLLAFVCLITAPVWAQDKAMLDLSLEPPGH
jgi:hypothetical protein